MFITLLCLWNYLLIVGNSSLSASTLVTVQILDVNDNSPVLVGDYSWKYLCTPRWEDQALVLASRDSDGPQHGGRLNFSLRSDATVRRNWKLTPINGSDNAKPALHNQAHIICDSWMRSEKNKRQRTFLMIELGEAILRRLLFGRRT